MTNLPTNIYLLSENQISRYDINLETGEILVIDNNSNIIPSNDVQRIIDLLNAYNTLRSIINEYGIVKD